DTCAGCHKSARELKRANAGFLRAHYTTGPVEAAAMASYLAGVGNGSTPEPRASQAKQTPDKPPAPEAGQQASRQPQPKAAQAPPGKKGRPVLEPKPTATSTATMILDSKLPDIPDPPPPAPLVLPPATATAAATATAKPKLEPFEE